MDLASSGEIPMHHIIAIAFAFLLAFAPASGQTATTSFDQDPAQFEMLEPDSNEALEWGDSYSNYAEDSYCENPQEAPDVEIKDEQGNVIDGSSFLSCLDGTDH